MKQPTTVPRTLKKIGRILLKSVLILLGIVILLLLLIQTPPVQNFLRGKAVSWLQKKLQTRVEVGKLYIGFPKKIILEGIYLEDRQKDTLFYGGRMKFDVNLWKLFKSELVVHEVNLEDITAKVKRSLPDTTFNFQFVIDAFASKEPSAPSTDTGSMKMQIDRVILNKVRARYDDVVNGSDMTVFIGHFDTRIDTFDPTHAVYAVPRTSLSGLRARIYQRKPLVEAESPATDKAEAAEDPGMQLSFREIDLEDCVLDYGNDESALYAKLQLGELAVNMRQLDLTKQIVLLDQLTLNGTTAAIRMGKKPAAKVVVKEVKQEVQAQAEAGWTVAVDELQLEKNAFRMDDDNAPKAKAGMDYSHLDLRDLDFNASAIRYSTDTISGRITEGSFTEQSGFTLRRLQTTFQYTAKGAYLHDLLVETPGTRLERSIDVSYPSLDALQKDISQLKLSLDVRDSKVQVKDILTFVPDLRFQPAFANPQATWLLQGQVNGSVSDLRITSLRLKGLQQTNVEMAGYIKGLPDMKKMQADLTIKDISSSARDVRALLPRGTLPGNITIPSQFNLSGKVKGTEKNLAADLLLNTTLGTATFKGTVQNPADSVNIGYDAVVSVRSFDLKQLLQQPDLGLLTLDLTVKGRGRDPKTMDATLDGTIAVAEYKGYTYRDLTLNGQIAQQQFKVNAGIQNEPIHLSLDATGSLAGAYPALKLHAVADSIKTLPLHLTTDNIQYRGNIDADFPLLNIDSLEGRLLVTKNLLVMGEQRIETDTLELIAQHSDSGQVIRLNSEALTAHLWGRYHLTELGTVMQRSIQKYFTQAGDSLMALPPYDFRVEAQLVKSPLLQGFAPDLKQLDPVNLRGHFTSNAGLDLSLEAPLIVYGTNEVNNFDLTVTSDGQMQAVATVDAFRSGESLLVYGTSLRATVADNKVDFTLGTKDINGKDKYHLEGLLAQTRKGVYEFSLRPDSLLLNYQPWLASAQNKVTIDPTNITADNFWLSYMDQRLTLQTRRDQTGQPLGVDFSRFRIGTLLSFVQKDSLLLDGELNGNISFVNITQEPVFAGDLTIKDVSMNKDTLGDLRAVVNNETPHQYEADITLSGRGNDVGVKGAYKAAEVSSFDFDVAVRQLQLNTLEGVSMGNIKKASGTVNGQFALHGTMDKPSVNGELNFNRAIVVPTMLGTPLKIDQTKIRINDEGVVFDNFTIRDSANNTAELDGMAYTTNFSNYKFDLVFNARNFQALNSTKKDNDLYYGTLFFNSRLNIKGTELHPVIDGSLKVNEKTKLTVVLPQDDPGVQDREGIVRFVDRDAVPNDSLWQGIGLDSLNTAAIRDYDISVNITVDKEAELNLIVDEGNGDLLRVKGEANLNGGIDPSGKVSLTGTYELQQGSYDLSFNFLRRKFNIQEGSRIIWQGEPTKAEVDITAMYIANTAPIDLVESQLNEMTASVRNTYRQKLPFEVYLIMTGQLLEPTIKFDIKLPEDKNYNVSKDIVENSNTKLEQLRQQPGELDKQVFSLLLLNRFMREDPFVTGNTGLSAEGFARQSVSKLLSEQLNQLAANLVAGVDINFDVESAEDYSTGEFQNRTDLNVQVSKRLLNDRLKVTVGSNFELEGAQHTNRQSNNIAGDVSLDYQLSKDGRYMLRAYRKNEYEGILEGYIVETGLGLVITIDYNKFRQLFESARKREARRLERQQRQKQLEEGREVKPPTVPEGK